MRTLFNIPNSVTLSGFGFIALYLLAAWQQHLPWALFWLFWAGFSDLADGYLAKRTGEITVLGAIIDPLRDRVLFLAIVWHLVMLKGFSIVLCWQFSLILICEALIVVVNCVWFRTVERVVVHVLGKTRQLVNVLFFVLLIILIDWEGVSLFKKQIQSLFLIPAGFSFLALLSYAIRWGES